MFSLIPYDEIGKLKLKMKIF